MFFKKIHFANPGMTEYIFATLYGRQFSEKLYETLREYRCNEWIGVEGCGIG